ncbi:MAG: type I restriction endonuclease subunit R, partial [Candidatus Parvarchaeota archaeon]
MPELGGERGAVQNPLIRYATDIGWQYVNKEEALRLRGSETGFVFREMFINQLLKLNSTFLTQDMAEELIRRLERIPPNIEGNLIVWEYLKGLRTVYVPSEKRER